MFVLGVCLCLLRLHRAFLVVVELVIRDGFKPQGGEVKNLAGAVNGLRPPFSVCSWFDDPVGKLREGTLANPSTGQDDLLEIHRQLISLQAPGNARHR